MRAHLQEIEPFIVNYTADTAEIYWLAGETEKAIAMLQPFRPGRTLELALMQASAGRYREAAAAHPRNAAVELARRNAGKGGEIARYRASQGMPPGEPAENGQSGLHLSCMSGRRNACWNTTRTR